jgi:hypothetical protein
MLSDVSVEPVYARIAFISQSPAPQLQNPVFMLNKLTITILRIASDQLSTNG